VRLLCYTTSPHFTLTSNSKKAEMVEALAIWNAGQRIAVKWNTDGSRARLRVEMVVFSLLLCRN